MVKFVSKQTTEKSMQSVLGRTGSLRTTPPSPATPLPCSLQATTPFLPQLAGVQRIAAVVAGAVRPVVVAAVGYEHRQAISVVPGTHQVVRRSLSGAVGVARGVGAAASGAVTASASPYQPSGLRKALCGMRSGNCAFLKCIGLSGLAQWTCAARSEDARR